MALSSLARLPWGRWHWLVCLALGISWVLDGLEVTTVGIIGDTLKKSCTRTLRSRLWPPSLLHSLTISTLCRTTAALGITSQQVGIIGSVYIGGAVFGSLFFGLLAGKSSTAKKVV